MNYAIPPIFARVFALVFDLRYRLTRSRPADNQDIAELLEARQSRAISVARDDNYWRYWSRGQSFRLSSCARIYVVVGEEKSGSRHEIHVAFDDWPPSTGEPRILMERHPPVNAGVGKPNDGMWDDALDA